MAEELTPTAREDGESSKVHPEAVPHGGLAVTEGP
jgi:hypothetical protein